MVEIKTQIISKMALITIDGDIDASSSIELDESLSQQLENTHLNIVVDCTDLAYISSAGLGVFMSYIEEFKSNGQKFVLFGLSKKVKNVFEMLGLDQLMNIVTDKEEAIRIMDEK
jgi:anti-sigma B factor antagonist